MPASAIPTPIQRHNLLYETLIHKHGLDNVCAAHLLVYGRRALHSYQHTHGRDLDVLVPFLTAAVGAWIDGQAGDREQVTQVADVMDAHMLTADYPAKLLKKRKRKRLGRSQGE